MKRTFIMSVGLVLFCYAGLLAQTYDHDHFVNFGVGYFYQSFAESDDFREASTSYIEDEIRFIQRYLVRQGDRNLRKHRQTETRR